NNVDRIRHDSVGEQSPKPVQREQRFPSPKLDPAEFLNMVSWQAPAQSEQRTSSTPASDIAGRSCAFLVQSSVSSATLHRIGGTDCGVVRYRHRDNACVSVRFPKGSS
uniref:SH2 domain-containing protein n=1 Tax=Angiostrongylus cantonensis TaxID=6313 RepID=A0A0K0D725_ANGCA